MSLSSQYLDQIHTNIRVRPVFWDGHVRANLLTADEAALIKTVDKHVKDTNISVSEATRFATSAIDLLTRFTRDDVVKYILSLIGDISVSGNHVLITALLNTNVADNTVFTALSNLLVKQDEPTHLLSCRALLGLANKQKIPEDVFTTFFKYISDKLLTSGNENLQGIGIQCTEHLLEKKWYRASIWAAHDDWINSVLDMLRSPVRTNIQLQYTTLLALWLLTFDLNPCKALAVELIPILLDISKQSVKEKIVRLAIAITVNSVKLAPKVSIPAILSHSGVSLIKTLSERKWADEELIADLSYLNETLKNAVASMSTFDEYSSEIVGHKLAWTPVHTSETFWKENIFRFKEHDYSIVKKLVSLLTASNVDSVTLAVACNDISHLLIELPESTKILESSGAKVKVMELMNSVDSATRFQALKATQAFIANSFK